MSFYSQEQRDRADGGQSLITDYSLTAADMDPVAHRQLPAGYSLDGLS